MPENESDLSRDEIMNLIVEQEEYLLKVARSKTNDPNTAEDLVQETFLKAIEHIDQLGDISRIRGWLRTILINLFRDGWRKDTVPSLDPASQYAKEKKRLIEGDPEMPGIHEALTSLFAYVTSLTYEEIVEFGRQVGMSQHEIETLAMIASQADAKLIEMAAIKGMAEIERGFKNATETIKNEREDKKPESIEERIELAQRTYDLACRDIFDDTP